MFTMKSPLMTLEGGVTIDRVFIWGDYKWRDYRQGSTVMAYHLMLRYNEIRYNGVDFVHC